MPTVAIVDGVRIRFYANEHPPAHFHAVFAEFSAQIEIESLKVLNGKLPPAKLAAVLLWAERRRDLLKLTWDKMIAGEKPENERFPGAVATYSIEAMMQDGKALQAGTSHYLGTGFAEAAGIRYQDKEGKQALCHTTSWGVSTRMIGGVIMTHGDDDGLRVPPAIAPHQIVILPMLREDDGDEALLAYCEELRRALVSQHALGEPMRVLLDSSLV